MRSHRPNAIVFSILCTCSPSVDDSEEHSQKEPSSGGGLASNSTGGDIGISSGGTTFAVGGSDIIGVGGSAGGTIQNSSGGSVGVGGSSGGTTQQCDRTEYCAFFTGTPTEPFTLKDERSVRTQVSYTCGLSMGREELCPFEEECVVTGAGQADCVSCGAEARRANSRTVNGVLVDECAGCNCAGWAVAGCYPPPNAYGEAFVDLTYQQGADVLRLAVLASGDVESSHENLSATISNANISISSGALIEFDLVLDYSSDNGGGTTTWQMTTHVVGYCPG